MAHKQESSLINYISQAVISDRQIRSAFIYVPKSEESEAFYRRNQIAQREMRIKTGVSTVKTLSQFLVRFVPAQIEKSLERVQDPPRGVDSVEAYKEYLDSSLHYALELYMYDQMMRDMARQLEKQPHEDKFLGSEINQSARESLLLAHADFFYSWFAQDDLDDNSLFRGTQIAYHEIYTPKSTTTIYDNAKQRFIVASEAFGPEATQRLNKSLNILDGYIKSDSSQNYYKFNDRDIADEFDHLTAKARTMINVSAETAFAIAHNELDPEIYDALVSATEAMWIANDLKDLTQPKLQKWYELKSGRINLPMALALYLLPESAHGKLISRNDACNLIATIWDRYKGVLQDANSSAKDKIEKMRELDSRPDIANRFHILKDMMIETGALNILWNEVNNRMNYMEAIKRKHSEAYFLKLYGLAVDYYLTEKRVKLLREYPQSIIGF